METGFAISLLLSMTDPATTAEATESPAVETATMSYEEPLIFSVCVAMAEANNKNGMIYLIQLPEVCWNQLFPIVERMV